MLNGVSSSNPANQPNPYDPYIGILTPDSLQHSTVIDCAEGTQIQLKRARFKPEHISKVFITHMHGTSLSPAVALLPTHFTFLISQ